MAKIPDGLKHTDVGWMIEVLCAARQMTYQKTHPWVGLSLFHMNTCAPAGQFLGSFTNEPENSIASWYTLYNHIAKQ